MHWAARTFRREAGRADLPTSIATHNIMFLEHGDAFMHTSSGGSPLQPPKAAGANSAIPLSVYDLTVAYHRKPVLWDVCLDVPEGKLVGIVGPNGAGKSTLIKAVMNLVPQLTIVSPPKPEFAQLFGDLPSFPSRSQGG